MKKPTDEQLNTIWQALISEQNKQFAESDLTQKLQMVLSCSPASFCAAVGHNWQTSSFHEIKCYVCGQLLIDLNEHN